MIAFFADMRPEHALEDTFGPLIIEKLATVLGSENPLSVDFDFAGEKLTFLTPVLEKHVPVIFEICVIYFKVEFFSFWTCNLKFKRYALKFRIMLNWP